jgi:NAD(P)-dependent dehydrogenase (short-subunit alcohol dehydrogenase family)
MTDRLKGKVALVTGGGSGIGRAAALAYAREGARVVVVDLDAEGGQATVDAIGNPDSGAMFVKADVSKQADVEAMIKRTVEVYGRLDCAFNNAGIEGAVGVATSDYTEDTWDNVINVNLKGVWLCMKHELSQMMKQGGGAIVNNASVAGLVGGSFGSAYYASKHGVVGLTKAAAVEYGISAIRVNAVCPGVIRTEIAERLLSGRQEIEDKIASLHPLGRLGTSGEVAETVIWLSSDEASFVTGQAIAVDGGYVAL